jgi:hypothetical protein
VTAGDVISEAGLDLRMVRARLPNTDPFAVPVVAAPPWLERVWRPWVKGSAGPRRIFVRPGLLEDPSAIGRLVVHELVHVDQWRQHGRIGFLARYVGGYGQGLLQHRSFSAAYRNLALEEEARTIADEVMASGGAR